jgi:hypothetical protein
MKASNLKRYLGRPYLPRLTFALGDNLNRLDFEQIGQVRTQHGGTDLGQSNATDYAGLTSFTHEVTALAVAVGPGWAIALVVAILAFIPYVGAVPLYLRLRKEDRADERKQKIEMTRLAEKVQNRSAKRLPPTPRALPGEKK